MGVQIPFSFPKSPDFKPFQTKIRVLPWQMNKTLIFINFLLVEFEMPHFAHVFGFLFDKRNVDLSSGHSTLCHIKANRGKTSQSVTLKRIRTVYGYRIRVYA